MKNCTTELATLLSSASEFICCDLFKWTLANGTIYYIADFDQDVVYLNNRYLHDSFLMKRGQTKTTGAPTVDSLSVSVYADRQHSDNIGNKYVLLAAHDGTLDDSNIQLVRAFFDKDTMAMLGGMPIFTGRAEVDSCTGTVLTMKCQSECTGLNASVPVRTFAPQNVYQQVSGGGVVSSSVDVHTCMIPLKPSRNVLVRL